MMSIQTVRDFFMWCSILNGTLLVLSTAILAFAGDWAYGIQRRWFPVSRQTFDVTVYAFIGAFKLIVLAFNVMPYIALLIIG